MTKGVKLGKMKKFRLDSGIVAGCVQEGYIKILHEADELMDTKKEFIKKLNDDDFYETLQSAMLAGGSLMQEVLRNS